MRSWLMEGSCPRAGVPPGRPAQVRPSRGRVATLVAVLLLPLAARGQSHPAPPPPPGRLVDIGQGVSLHIDCTGRGGPSVILLHGLGDYSFDWALVQPEIAKSVRTCSYDRAGVAWSSPGRPPRGPEATAQELRALLQRAGIKPPYVLVGHSWGGLIARMYAHDYPGEVAGLVLVDSTHEDEYLWVNGKVLRPLRVSTEEWESLTKPKPRPGAAQPQQADPPAQAAVAAPPPRLEPPFDKLPPDAQKLRLWAMSLPWSQASFEGGDSLDLRSDLIQVHKALDGEHPLGKIPVVVVSKTLAPEEDYTEEQVEWNHGLQDKLAGESTNSLHLVAKNSGHHIQLEDPRLVSAAIRGVLAAVRAHKPLTSIQVTSHDSF